MKENNQPPESNLRVNRYIPPPDHPLQPYLQSIWRGQDDGTIHRETVLPDGTLSIIFCLAGPHLLYGRAMHEPLSFEVGFVSGIKTQAFLAQPTSRFSLLGINLKMEACAALLPLPVNELIDLPVEAKLIFKDAESIHEKLLETLNFRKQCTLLLDWLQTLLSPPTKHKLIRHVCASLREMPSESKIKEIARSLGISERHLRRLFLQQVGVSPARYLRLSRFIKTIYLIPGSSSLTEIAHAAEYTDQAHFCRDFKEIAGMTPKEYREGVDGVPGHIFSG